MAQVGTLGVEASTTAAVVKVTSMVFANNQGMPDADVIEMQFEVSFNGFTGDTGNSCYFARNATTAQKQTAVRERLNLILADSEPGVVLNNANIQISGRRSDLDRLGVMK